MSAAWARAETGSNRNYVAERHLELVAEMATVALDVPVAAVSLVQEDGLWCAARVGITDAEVPRARSLCNRVAELGEPLVVSDLREYPSANEWHTPIAEKPVVFYAGAPVHTDDGDVVAVLCAMDFSPRQPTEAQLALFRRLAASVASLVELRRTEQLLEEERTQSELRKSETQAILDGVLDGVVVQNRDGVIRGANSAASKISGLTPAELVGLEAPDPRWRLVDTDGAAFPCDEHPAVVALRTGSEVTDVIIGVRCPTGETCWMSVNARPMFREGQREPHAVISTFRDITERRTLTERLGAHERVAALGSLAAGVGHEINNPLSYVLSNLELALEETRNVPKALRNPAVEELERLLAEARGGAERIRRIVRGLRSLVQRSASSTPIPVAPAIEGALEIARHELRLKATIDVEIAVVPPVSADSSGLMQAVANLLVNAAQAFRVSDPSRNRVVVRTRVEDASSQVGSNTGGSFAGRVAIDVVDNGAGIPPEILPRIFDPFFTTRGVGQGTGLGLSTAYSLIQAFGGDLRCHTGVGEGTTFTILLPVAEEIAAPDDDTEAIGRSRVLLIDDEPIIVRSMTRILGNEHQVTSVSDPREAVPLLRTGDYDLVICDLLMPHLSGIELYDEALASNPELASRFVFITGDTSREDVRLFLARVPNERLEKPFSAQNVRGIARRYAALRSRRDSGRRAPS